MKILSLWAGMLMFVLVSTISPASLNGRFVVVSSDTANLKVKLQINSNTGTSALGGATIVLSFDESILNYSNNPVKLIDYAFQNFSNGNYSEATVTKPMNGKLWINIDLPYVNNGKGTLLSADNSWTDVVTLNFRISDNTKTIKLNWNNTSSFWGIYNADNKTLLTDGTLTNLEIAPLVIDHIAPDVTNITATNNRSVTLNFSEKLDAVSAKDKNNYTISNGISISQVQLLPDSSSVLIKTTQIQNNIDYSLSIKNVKDVSGNIISPNPRVVNYKISSKSKGGRVKNTVSYATASSWEDSFTAEKTVDGIADTYSDSRWKSSKNLPDTLTYDFGDDVVIDSLRIAFYKGENGRLYKYSVYSSDDMKNWKPVVNNIWSEETAWTEIEFDSTAGRYVKLILKDCNQGQQASIWEFESYGTRINNDINTDVPAKFELSQNYPNPFNPSTKIRYTIPQTSNDNNEMLKVLIKVYDILGNEVRTLVDETQNSGEHEVEFNATGLASGVYIYRFESASYVDTKKMVLLR